jgi:(p)ppGpp synthase/HD superfamily hydrolase
MVRSRKELLQTRAAIEFAERRHTGRYRGDGTPSILHPIEVALLLLQNCVMRSGRGSPGL